jgi:hypothetical protein
VRAIIIITRTRIPTCPDKTTIIILIEGRWAGPMGAPAREPGRAHGVNTEIFCWD